MALMSKLLSQHEMLTTLCSYLSSADIAHLAATSKELRIYMKDSPEIYDHLNSHAVCDGTGQITREKLFFGKRPRDEGKMKNDCRGADAKPCSGCKAMVCNNCRFHFVYICETTWGDISDDLYAAIEDDMTEELEAALLEKANGWVPIQAKKAFGIYMGIRIRFYCLPCHPLLLPLQNYYDDTCSCSLFDNFVGNRWLCIPCLLKEEVDMITNHQTPGCFYSKELCDCGSEPHEYSYEVCRVCNKAGGWQYPPRDQAIVQKYLEQLGYQEEKKGELKEVLEQLG